MTTRLPSRPAVHAETIHLRLRDLAQLFNSLDPTPFPSRALDAAAEEFIVVRARELPAEPAPGLTIHLATPPDPHRAAQTESAVRHHFAERAETKWREFRLLMHRGRVSLLIGLLFLALCLTLSNVFDRLGVSTLTGILNESFLIVGWVAMWRPLEIYLYDWWPLRAERRVFLRLSRVRVKLVLPETPA